MESFPRDSLAASIFHLRPSDGGIQPLEVALEACLTVAYITTREFFVDSAEHGPIGRCSVSELSWTHARALCSLEEKSCLSCFSGRRGSALHAGVEKEFRQA